jgi:RNA polymerase sigma factor (sigma-70 family)
MNPLGVRSVRELDLVEIHRWVTSARQGDEEAFASLMRAYYPRLYRTVFEMVPSREDTEEILQETFFRLFKSLGRLRAGEDPFPFLRTIAVRRTYTYLKTRRAAAVSIEDLPENIPELSIEGTSMGVADLYGWAASLPPQRRLVFILREVEGFETREIAAMMGLREATVRRHASLAADEFRKRFGK